MRHTISDIVSNTAIDLKNEYKKLYDLLYGKRKAFDDEEDLSLHDIFAESFPSFYFKGTCLTLEEFDKNYGFKFKKNPENFSIDDLVSLAEYFYNMIIGYQSASFRHYSGYPLINTDFLINHIMTLMQKIGYKTMQQNYFTVFVPASEEITAVAESDMLSKPLSERTLLYNHYNMKGKIEDKKAILLQYASFLEGKREDLKKANNILENDLFFMFNNLNIRHNNIDPSLSSNYKPYIANMSANDLEKLYDETYRMCLLAIMELEHYKRKKLIEELKDHLKQA